MFDIDFEVQIIRLLPPFLRSPKMIAWLRAMLSPLVRLHQRFVGYRNQTLRALSITPSTYSLEWYLNFIFTGQQPTYVGYSLDYSGGGIWIENNNESEPLSYVYDANDNQQTMFVYDANDDMQTYLYDYKDYLNNDSFIVHIPTMAGIDENYLRAILNKYKIAGNGYSVSYY